MGNHSKYSPSAVDRWAVCTKSIEACEGLPEQESVYADEGTAAHERLALAITTGVAPPKEDTELHFAYMVGVYPWLQREKVLVFSEVPVVVSPECYGTADVVAIDNELGVLHVADLKWGQGVTVEADCGQLKVYLCAARKTLAIYFDKPIDRFVATVIQPRKPHAKGLVRSVEYTGAELDAFEADLLATIAKIESGDTRLTPTEKACRWCRAKTGDPARGIGPCKAVASLALEAVRAQFSPIDKDGVVGMALPPKSVVATLSHAEIGAILNARPLIEDFLNAVEAAAQSVLMAGGKIPELKIVHGKANRKWAIDDENELVKILMDEIKLKRADIFQEKLKGIPAIEKMVDPAARNGKKKAERLKALITKPDGKPVIVPESDPREAIVMLTETVNALA